ncbi:MAG: rhamnan synthesis F family protein [Candidatus Nanopelagicales bacterium]
MVDLTLVRERADRYRAGRPGARQEFWAAAFRPRLDLVVTTGMIRRNALRATLDSLDAQWYPNWQATVTCGPEQALLARLVVAAMPPRARRRLRVAAVPPPDIPAPDGQPVYRGQLEAGVVLRPDSLSILAPATLRDWPDVLQGPLSGEPGANLSLSLLRPARTAAPGGMARVERCLGTLKPGDTDLAVVAELTRPRLLLEPPAREPALPVGDGSAIATQLPARFARPAPTAVLVHVFYPDLLSELLTAARRIPQPTDLIVTNASGAVLDLPADLRARFANLGVLNVANRGRDILPMIELANAGWFEPYTAVLKLHTKRSQWRAAHELAGSGEAWRDALLTSLAGDSATAARCLELLRTDREVGLITAPGSLLGPDYWGRNEAATQALAQRLGIAFDLGSVQFPAGSMYWVRGTLLARLRDLRLTARDFPAEAGQTNLTLAHAVERVLGVMVTAGGQICLESLPPEYLPAPSPS